MRTLRRLPYPARFILGRIASALFVLAVVTTLVFMLVRAAPGSPEDALLKGTVATPQTRAAVRAEFRLNDPVATQYVSALENTAALNFGTSFATKEDIWTAIVDRAKVTLPLIALALVLTFAVGLPIGILAAYHQGGAIDRSAIGVSIFGASVPSFAVAILLLYVFSTSLGWFPAVGQWSNPLEALWHLTLPAIALALTGIAPLVRYTRASVTGVLGSDHVIFSTARGMSARHTFIHDVLHNAAFGVLAITGIIVIYMFSAVSLVEVTFNLNGLGAYLVRAVTNQDFPVIQALAVLTTIVILAVNFFVDAANLMLDPRLRIKVMGE